MGIPSVATNSQLELLKTPVMPGNLRHGQKSSGRAAEKYNEVLKTRAMCGNLKCGQELSAGAAENSSDALSMARNSQAELLKTPAMHGNFNHGL
jgi:hypothetical protein